MSRTENVAAAPKTRDEQIDDQQKKADADFASQMKMNDLQRQVNSNNTYIMGLSSLEKGKDDVMKTIANHLK